MPNIVKKQEKEIIRNSYLWDAEWYCKTYNHDMTQSEALDYWYEVGCEHGENPSKYMNLKYFPDFEIFQNPIIAYLSKNKPKCFYADDKNNFKSWLRLFIIVLASLLSSEMAIALISISIMAMTVIAAIRDKKISYLWKSVICIIQMT